MAAETAPPTESSTTVPSKAPSIKIVVDGTPKEFATAEELQTYVNQVNTEAGVAAALKSSMEAAHRVVLGTCTDDEFRELYKASGYSDEDTTKMLEMRKAQSTPVADPPVEDDPSEVPAPQKKPRTTSKPKPATSLQATDDVEVDPETVSFEDLSKPLQKFMADSYQVAKGSLAVLGELNAGKIEESIEKDTTVGPFWERMTPGQRDHLITAVRTESGVKKVLDSGGLLKRNELDVVVRAAQKYCEEVHGAPNALASKDNGSAGNAGRSSQAPILGAETAVTSPFPEEELNKVKTDEYIELDGSLECQRKLELQMHAVNQRQLRSERETPARY